MLLASITDSVVQFATDVVDSLGLTGIFVLMLAESACIPIPSEATMLFAGFGVAQGRFSLIEITAVGVAGNLVGSWLAYWVGYYGRMEFVERHAHKLRIKPSHIAWADRWFSRYGEPTVLVTRTLPIIRTFISLPAGVARMPFIRFTVFTVIGCIPWVFLLGFVGVQVGRNWTHWKDALSYVDYAVVVLVVVWAIHLILRRGRTRGARRRSESRQDNRQVSTSHDHGADPEHKAGVDGQAGDAQIAVPTARARVQRERRGETAEVPGQPEEQRD